MTQLALNWNDASFKAALHRFGLSEHAVCLVVAVQKMPRRNWFGEQWAEASKREVCRRSGLNFHQLIAAQAEAMKADVLDFKDGLDEPHLWRVNLSRVFPDVR